MEDEELKSELRRGLLLAFVPALLFYPVVGFLTICPPNYGQPLMVIFSLAFLWSETAAGRALLKIRQRKLDWINLLTVVGIAVASIVTLAVAWLFVAPIYFGR
jgi:hypothetical protein